jgi:hypothetical protein
MTSHHVMHVEKALPLMSIVLSIQKQMDVQKLIQIHLIRPKPKLELTVQTLVDREDLVKTENAVDIQKRMDILFKKRVKITLHLLGILLTNNQVKELNFNVLRVQSICKSQLVLHWSF